MKKFFPALILCIFSITWSSCASSESKQEEQKKPTVILHLGSDQYVTDPNTGVQYNKGSLYAPQVEDNSNHN